MATMSLLWFVFLSLTSAGFMDFNVNLFERDDACTAAFGTGWTSDICKPNNTLCCIKSGQDYPQCRTGLGNGWCCVSDSSCYVDQASVCTAPGSVPCTPPAGEAPGCCPQGTTCAAGFDQTSSAVRCNIAASALNASPSSTTSSSSSTSTSTSTSSGTTSGTSTQSTPSASSSSPAASSPSASPPSSSSALSSGQIAGIVLGPTLAILLVGLGLWYTLRRNRNDRYNEPRYTQQEKVGDFGQNMHYNTVSQSHQHYELSTNTRPAVVELD